MAYPLPSLPSLSRRARALFEESNPGAVADLWPNTYTITAKVLALLGQEFHLRLRWLYDQLFASTADELHLVRHGYELGLTRTPAVRAGGTATADATPGLTVPTGLRFRRADGAGFAVEAAATAVGNSVTLALRAEEPGAGANSAPGEALTAVDPDALPGLGRLALVDAGGIGGGADAEGVEAFRARVLARKRNPPHGGSAADWAGWAMEAGGVVKAHVDSFANSTRDVWIAVLVAGRTNGVPTAADVAAVQAYVADPIRRPVTARVTVVAPVPQPVAVTIAGLSPDTVAVRASVLAELAAVFADRARPALPSAPFALPRAWIDEAVSIAAGEASHTLTAPAADLAFTTPGHLPVLGTVTFV